MAGYFLDRPHLCNLKNKINEQAEHKHTHSYGEHFDGSQMRGALDEMGEKHEGIKQYRLVVTK